MTMTIGIGHTAQRSSSPQKMAAAKSKAQSSLGGQDHPQSSKLEMQMKESRKPSSMGPGRHDGGDCIHTPSLGLSRQLGNLSEIQRTTLDLTCW